MEKENNGPETTRRSFLNYTLYTSIAGLAAAILYPVVKYIIPPETSQPVVTTVRLGKPKEYKPGTGTIFKFGTKPGLLIRLDNGDFRAFIAVCTHLQCTVQYRDDEKLIWCACHNGKYDLNGKNISGPPPRPLTELKVLIKDGNIFISKEV